jgi:hypothetical protein
VESALRAPGGDQLARRAYGAQAVEAQAFVRHRKGDSSVFLQQSRRGVEESDRIDKMFDDMTGDDRVKGVQLVMQKRFERSPPFQTRSTSSMLERLTPDSER